MKHYALKEMETKCPTCAKKMKDQNIKEISLPDDYFNKPTPVGTVKLKLSEYKYNKETGKACKGKPLNIPDNRTKQALLDTLKAKRVNGQENALKRLKNKE